MKDRFQARYFAPGDREGLPATVQLTDSGLAVVSGNGAREIWPWQEVKEHFANDRHRVYLSRQDHHLEVLGQDFLTALESAGFHSNRQRRSMSGYGWLWSLLLMITAAVLLWIYALPAFAGWLAMRIPAEAEKKAGDAIWQNISSEETIDTFRSGLAREYFNRLIDPAADDVEVWVTKSETINAFALPGGRIVVCSGLLDKLEEHTELAALLGHEYGHVVNRHVLRGMVQSLSTYMLLSLLIGDLGGVAGVLIEQGNMIYNLKFSRSYESESDEFSRQLLERRRIDPAGMNALFRHLRQKTDSLGQVPEFLSTHPGLDFRLRKSEEWAGQARYAVEKDTELEGLFEQLRLKH